MQQSSKAQDRVLGVWFQMSEDFNSPLRARAEQVERAMEMRVQGDSPQLESLWATQLADKSPATPEAFA